MDPEISQNTSDLSFAQRRARQFKQQQIPSVISNFSLKCIHPILIAAFVFFTTVGVVVLLTSANDEFRHDYTDCISTTLKQSCEEYLKGKIVDKCVCSVTLDLPRLIKNQVYLYYRLVGFFQNERTFTYSIDYAQLAGGLGPLSDDCKPYRTRVVNLKTINIAPCGAIANAMFNDSFKLSRSQSSVPLIRTGIAYSYDKRFRFKNPPNWDDTVQPPFWHKPVFELDTEDPGNNGYQNEDLIVWLRPGAFKSPRKLHRLVDHRDDAFKEGLPSGEYTLNVDYNYPVSSFGGRKEIILSSVGWLGTSSLFISISYLIVGICSGITSLAIIIFSKNKS